jgi:hypothetical protein
MPSDTPCWAAREAGEAGELVYQRKSISKDAPNYIPNYQGIYRIQPLAQTMEK